MKKVLLAVFGLCLGLTLVGCGGTSESSGDDAGTENGGESSANETVEGSNNNGSDEGYQTFTIEIPTALEKQAPMRGAMAAVDVYASSDNIWSMSVYESEQAAESSLDAQYETLMDKLQMTEKDWDVYEKTTLGDYACIKIAYDYKDTRHYQMVFYSSDNTVVDIEASCQEGAPSSAASDIENALNSVSLK